MITTSLTGIEYGNNTDHGKIELEYIWMSKCCCMLAHASIIIFCAVDIYAVWDIICTFVVFMDYENIEIPHL